MPSKKPTSPPMEMRRVSDHAPRTRASFHSRAILAIPSRAASQGIRARKHQPVVPWSNR